MADISRLRAFLDTALSHGILAIYHKPSRCLIALLVVSKHFTVRSTTSVVFSVCDK
jgi:hypothetical protein